MSGRIRRYKARRDWPERVSGGTKHVETGPSELRTYADQGALSERHDPVLIPEHLEELVVEAGLEEGDVEAVVAGRVDAKVFDLVERDGLVLGGLGVGRGVVLCANVCEAYRRSEPNLSMLSGLSPEDPLSAQRTSG